MKRFMKLFFVALVVGALASFSVLAGDKGDKGKVEKKTVMFPDDVMVNGTLVKAGDYEVKFDEGTGSSVADSSGQCFWRCRSLRWLARPRCARRRLDRRPGSRCRTLSFGRCGPPRAGIRRSTLGWRGGS